MVCFEEEETDNRLKGACSDRSAMEAREDTELLARVRVCLDRLATEVVEDTELSAWLEVFAQGREDEDGTSVGGFRELAAAFDDVTTAGFGACTLSLVKSRLRRTQGNKERKVD